MSPPSPSSDPRPRSPETPSRPDPATLQVTQLLQRMSAGDGSAEEELARALYRELHSRARGYVGRRPANETLQATALVHEVWMKVRRVADFEWRDRQHFFATASRAMRQILVDRSRARRRLKRDARRVDQPLDEIVVEFERRSGDLDQLDRALVKLGGRNPELARLVELRFFGGLEAAEAAEVMGMALRTFERRWAVARAWLRAELASSSPDSEGSDPEDSDSEDPHDGAG